MTNSVQQWPGPRLLVPMSLSALVVSQNAQQALWSRQYNQYVNIGRFGQIAPSPGFSGSGVTPPPVGVTLQWALPDALTQGMAQEDGSVVYPVLPNRWLVLRMWVDKSQKSGKAVQGWVIQSDITYRDTAGTPAGSPFVNIQNTMASSFQNRIGLHCTLEDWVSGNGRCGFTNKQTSTGPYDLTALGSGDASFAAYNPNINDVFAFYDPLTNINPSPLTYLVAGWYETNSKDPLLGVSTTAPNGWQTPDEWVTLMSSFAWSLGWQAGTEDPLHAPDTINAVAAGQAWLQTHDISFDASNPQSQYAAQTLCHGMVFNVNWTGPNGATQLGVPQPPANQVDVAVANSTVDAMCALVGKYLGSDYPNVEQLLEAFLYNALDEYDRYGFDASIVEIIRNYWFGKSNQGILWRFQAPENDDPSNPTPAPSAEMLTQLDQLNTLQTQINQLTTQLLQQQGELYRAWWKYSACQNQITPPSPAICQQATTAYNNAASAVQNLNQQISSALTQRNTIAQQLCSSLGGQSSTADGNFTCTPDPSLVRYQLISEPDTRFHHPNNPVVMVLGATQNYTRGQDGRLSGDNSLFCRFSGQTIDSITVNTNLSQTSADCNNNAQTCYTVTNTDLNLKQQINIGSNIPFETLDLLLETYLLDTTNAQTLAQIVLSALGLSTPSVQDLAVNIAKEQTLVWNSDLNAALDKQTLAEMSGLNGVIPSKIAVDAWTPPWLPVSMDWQIKWVSSYTDPTRVLSDGLWEFDHVAQDYVWNSSPPNVPDSAPVITGRTIIAPNASNIFVGMLEKYLSDHSAENAALQQSFLNRAAALMDTSDSDTSPDPGTILQAILDTIRNWNLLSQEISSFNLLLLTQDPTQHIPVPSSTMWNAQSVAEMVGSGGTTMPAVFGNPGFFPTRAGHFQLQNLWVVDEFGQVFDPIGTIAQSGSFSPVTGIGMTTQGNSRLVELPPRIIQDAQIAFDFIANDESETPITVDTSANPVCGWFLPNHLDQSLMVYDAQGNSLGEILNTGAGINRRAYWQVPPALSAAIGVPPDISNPYLASVVNGLLGQANSAQALVDFMTVIDRSLWTTDPFVTDGDQNLAVLIGRPLALVRAQVYFELYGQPEVDQNWAATGNNVTKNFFNAEFVVEVGDFRLPTDGVLGYYLNDVFTRFQAVYMPSSVKPGYVIQEDFALPFNYPGQSAPYTKATLTLLVDPRGIITLLTGVLPNLQVAVPAQFTAEPIQQMDVTFQMGPLLTPADTVRMPIPANIQGNWTWIEHSGIEILSNNIQQATDKPRLESAPSNTLREGWLKLSDITNSGSS